MKAKELVKLYLDERKVMQIASVSGDQPWICSVYFVADEEQHLYWLSWPTRRHSQELAVHAKAAIAIAIKTTQPVIGIQAEGRVEKVTAPNKVASVMKKYVERHKIGGDFYNNFISGKNQHHVYRFVPGKLVLFDEVNFPQNPRQEITL